ncbi:MAG: hypothetical protein ILP19_02065 [Oscillospiraceae bacterium]|nr:hypothetical protein [Oscillospiraceae bacterium]
MKKNKQHTDEQKKNGFLTPRQIRYAVATAVLMFCLLGFSAAFVLRVYFMTESECYALIRPVIPLWRAFANLEG